MYSNGRDSEVYHYEKPGAGRWANDSEHANYAMHTPPKTKRAYSEALVTLVNFCGDNVLNSWVPFLPFLLDRGARPAAADVSWQ